MRGHQERFDTIVEIERDVDTYFSQNAIECIFRVKSSESGKTLTQVSKDLFDLLQQFKATSEFDNAC